MGDVFMVDSVMRSRKRHWCAYCGKEIPTGSPYVREHGIYDGTPYVRPCCTYCDPLRGGFWEFVDGEAGFIDEEFREYLLASQKEHFLTVEAQCPDCGAVRVLREDFANDEAVCPKCGEEVF